MTYLKNQYYTLRYTVSKVGDVDLTQMVAEDPNHKWITDPCIYYLNL